MNDRQPREAAPTARAELHRASDGMKLGPTDRSPGTSAGRDDRPDPGPDRAASRRPARECVIGVE